jgi:hypothetical protein
MSEMWCWLMVGWTLEAGHHFIGKFARCVECAWLVDNRVDCVACEICKCQGSVDET